jgi:hypothetical protein
VDRTIGAPLDELCQRELTERRAWSVGALLHPEVFGQYLKLEERLERLDVEQLVSELALVIPGATHARTTPPLRAGCKVATPPLGAAANKEYHQVKHGVGEGRNHIPTGVSITVGQSREGLSRS